jgi:DNA-binding NarL/FixJ family response regulator
MRIFVINSQAVVRAGLKAVLGGFVDAELAGEASSVDAALPVAPMLVPDLLVIELPLSGADLRTAITRLRQGVPSAQIALLTSVAVAQDLIDVVGAGALGYILKSEPVESVMAALRRVSRGQYYVTPELEHVFDRLRRARFPATVLDVLSPRERLVFRLVAEGVDAAGIAGRFGVSRKTIETHKCRILKKFGLGNTAALVRFAAVQGFVDGAAQAQNEPGAITPPG